MTDKLPCSDGLPGVIWEQIACPLCHSQDSKRVCETRDVLHGLPGRFRLVRCRGCSHVYLNPRPTPETICHYYPADYSPHAAPVDPEQEGTHESSSSRSIQMAKWIPGLRGLYYWLKETCAEVVPPVNVAEPRALELGCGNGGFLKILRNKGWQAEGLEPAEAAVTEARRKGFRVHHGIFTDGLYDENSQNAVFAWMVLEHLHDPVRALHEIHRILKPGGWFVASVPNWGCWEPRVLGPYWYSLQLPTHLHQFTPHILRRTLADCGFEHVRVIHQRNVFNLLGSLGLYARERFPKRRLGSRLLEFIANPSVRGQLALAPLAKVLAWIHQGGRLTVTARK